MCESLERAMSSLIFPRLLHRESERVWQTNRWKMKHRTQRWSAYKTYDTKLLVGVALKLAECGKRPATRNKKCVLNIKTSLEGRALALALYLAVHVLGTMAMLCLFWLKLTFVWLICGEPVLLLVWCVFLHSCSSQMPWCKRKYPPTHATEIKAQNT